MRHFVARTFGGLSIVLTVSCGGSPGDEGATSEEIDGSSFDIGDETSDPASDDSATTDDAASGDAVAPIGKPDTLVGTESAPTPPGAPTFTELYGTLFANKSFASNCTGSSCHAPGKQKGLDFSSKTVGYATVMKFVIAGKPDSSKLVSVLTSGSMPDLRPKFSSANLAKVRAWITAGAKND